MIDYRSTDRSVEIIRRLAPTWEIRPTRNEQFHSLSIDAEVMDIEATIAGWKMCLNVTEFVLHDNLKQYVAEFERVHPGAREVVTTGFVIQAAPDQLDAPLSDADLWDQRHFGSHEPAPRDGLARLPQPAPPQGAARPVRAGPPQQRGEPNRASIAVPVLVRL